MSRSIIFGSGVVLGASGVVEGVPTERDGVEDDAVLLLLLSAGERDISLEMYAGYASARMVSLKEGASLEDVAICS